MGATLMRSYIESSLFLCSIGEHHGIGNWVGKVTLRATGSPPCSWCRASVRDHLAVLSVLFSDGGATVCRRHRRRPTPRPLVADATASGRVRRWQTAAPSGHCVSSPPLCPSDTCTPAMLLLFCHPLEPPPPSLPSAATAAAATGDLVDAHPRGFGGRGHHWSPADDLAAREQRPQATHVHLRRRVEGAATARAGSGSCRRGCGQTRPRPRFRPRPWDGRPPWRGGMRQLPGGGGWGGPSERLSQSMWSGCERKLPHGYCTNMTGACREHGTAHETDRSYTPRLARATW